MVLSTVDVMLSRITLNLRKYPIIGLDPLELLGVNGKQNNVTNVLSNVELSLVLCFEPLSGLR